MSARARRRAFLVDFCSPSTVLEIGALDYPTFEPGEVDLRFADYLSTEDLAEKGSSNPRFERERLVEVDYVCTPGRYAEVIEERFDLIVANHVIEHVPDVVRWLDDLRALLVPGGGIFLAVPDSRFTFDVVRSRSTFVDLMRAYDAEQNRPDRYQVLSHLYFYRAVKADELWEGVTDGRLDKGRFGVEDAMRRATALAEGYADVHCHVFQGDTFARDVMRPLIDLGLARFELVATSEVAKNTNEFFVFLRRDASDDETVVEDGGDD